MVTSRIMRFTNRRVDGAMLMFDLSGYPFGSGAEASLFATSPVLWVGVTVCTIVWAIRAATSGHGRLAVGVALLVALPRLRLYAVSFLLARLDEAGPRSMRR